MDSDYRKALFEQLHPKTAQFTQLQELDREYSLEEICIVTRAAPAKALGLSRKGRLGNGADADVAIYRLQEDKEKMFARPAYVLKDGQVVVRDGEVVQSFGGRRLVVEPDGSKRLPPDLAKLFADYYSVALSNFAVQDEYLPRREVIPCA
jgi:formylmethanofuran dehydrogenase subunit A